MPALLEEPHVRPPTSRSREGETQRANPKAPGIGRSPASDPPRSVQQIARVQLSQKTPSAFARPLARSTRFVFFANWSLEKTFTLCGLLVAASLGLVFGLDLAIGWPFRHESASFGAALFVSSLGLAYMSYDVMRDQLRGRQR